MFPGLLRDILLNVMMIIEIIDCGIRILETAILL